MIDKNIQIPVFKENGDSFNRIHVRGGNTTYEVANAINLNDHKEPKSSINHLIAYQKTINAGKPNKTFAKIGLSDQKFQVNCAL